MKLHHIAIILWLIAGLVICGKTLVQNPKKQNVYPVFVNAGRNWVEGKPLYQRGAETEYRYLPVVAAFFAPFAYLPDRLGGFIWRMLNFAVFLGAFWWCCQAGIPRKLSKEQIGLIFLMVIPMSIGSLNNGQSNPLMTGAILLGVAGVMSGFWWIAGIGVAVACLLKVYPIAVAMLIGLVFPIRFGLRFLIAVGAGLLLPYLFQKPAYVSEQYQSLYTYLRTEDRADKHISDAYKDLRLIYRYWTDEPMPEKAFVATQLAVAGLIAGVCLLGWWQKWPRKTLLMIVVGLACCWMTALGPSTESSTYILLAPALAWCLMESSLARWPKALRWMILLSCALLVTAAIGVIFPKGRQWQLTGLQPAGALILMVALFGQAVVYLKRRII